MRKDDAIQSNHQAGKVRAAAGKYSCTMPLSRLSDGKDPCFFGYFDKFQDSPDGARVLAGRIRFAGRQPAAGDTMELGIIRLETPGVFEPFAVTRAFCFQQGCMLQWLPGEPNSVLFNDRMDGSFVTRILNLDTGREKILPRASYCVAPDGGFTLGINFSCLETERPGYGYAGVVDSYAGEHHSPHDGIYRIDIATGKSRLIISLDDIVGIQTEDSMLIRKNWFNHLLISPDGGHFAFFHRWRQANGGHLTRMYTAQCDGGNIYLLNPDNMTSHYCWIDPAHIIAYAHRFGAGNHYYKFTDLSRDYEIIGERLYDDDGHCSISPDKQWMLTDTYPDRDHFRTLILHHLAENRRMDIGRFFSVPDWAVPERCDLHPRWSRDGQKIFFDSSHEHSRQIYMIDLKELQ